MDIRIYQINMDRNENGLAFLPYDFAAKKGIDCAAYDKVFEGQVDISSLEQAYTKFNLDIPSEYRGRSLSVSDVCEVIENGQSKFYYCDSVGFKEIPFDTSMTQDLKSNTITVVMCNPGKTAEIVELPKGLDSMQEAVGGYIEAVYPFEDQVCIVCNEEGKINGMPLNRALYDANGEMYDIVAGPCFICDCSGEDFGSLNRRQQEKYLEQFRSPEMFIRMNDGIHAIKTEGATQHIKQKH